MNKISLFKYVIAAMFCLNSAFAMETGHNQNFLPVVSTDSSLTRRTVSKKVAETSANQQNANEVKISIPKAESSAKAQNSSLFKRAISKVADTLKAGVNFVKNNPKKCIAITAAAIGTVVYFYSYYIPTVPRESIKPQKPQYDKNPQFRQEAHEYCAAENPDYFKKCFNKKMIDAERFCKEYHPGYNNFKECLQNEANYIAEHNECIPQDCWEKETVVSWETCMRNPDFGKCLNQVIKENTTECENQFFKPIFGHTPNQEHNCLCIAPEQNKCVSAQDLCTDIKARNRFIPATCNGATDVGPWGFSFNQLEKLKNGYCSKVLKNEKAQNGATQAFQKAANWCKQDNNAEQTIKIYYDKRYCEKSAQQLKDIENPMSDLYKRSINDREEVKEVKNDINLYREAKGCDYFEKCFPDLTNNK